MCEIESGRSRSSPRWNWRSALDALLPPTQRTGAEAVARVDWRPDRPGEYCPRCGASVGFGAITIHGCPHCRGRRIAWDGLWRIGVYQPPLSRWIRDCKFHRAWAWADWFGRRLAERALAATDPDPAVIVPVPLHRRRRLQRGYDQSLLLARAIARHADRPLAPLLHRRRPTRPQTDLHSREARRQNVRGAFVLREPVDLAGTSVWLVDDVKTTGATLHACARLLKRAGAERVRALVVAVADPKRGDFQRS